MKVTTLIYNPIAGRRPKRRERQVQEAAARLQNAGFEVKLARTSEPGTARKLARAAVTEGSELILVCGGDGTINEVINGLVPGEVPLGILPGGTANILARELGLPQDPVSAAMELPRWSPRRIALGQATWFARAPSGARTVLEYPTIPLAQFERRYFMSVAGIGFDAYIVHKLSVGFKKSLGVVAYGLEALRQVVRYPFPTFTCQTEVREFLAPFAVVHRTCRYAGWMKLAPGASIFDPRFRLCLFKGRGWARYLLYAAAVLARRHLKLPDVKLVEAAQVICRVQDSEKPVYFELDGEPAGQLPVTFEVVPNALTLLVP